MTQADSVHSTPPTNTSANNQPSPVDPTRRRFLSVAAVRASLDATDIMRVGPIEFDTLNRTVRRGERAIVLRPRESRLLKYMMERCGQLLTRAKLLEDVWNYKFIPETMVLVDVHMGKLRRKVDGPNEAPMIRNVRGAGFILSATELGGAA
jgi:two-component system OmpR family response regulator